MPARPLAGIALALLVATSGCLGILGMGGNSTPAPTPATAAEPTPTPTPAPKTTNLTGLKADHRGALMNSSGWRIESTITLSTNGSGSILSELSITEEARIDLANHRYWKRSAGFLGPTVKYTNESVTVKKQTLGNSTSYSYTQKPYENGSQLVTMQPVNVTRATGIDFILVHENITYTKQGTATVNGVNTTKYVLKNATDLLRRWQELSGGSANMTLTGETSNVTIKDFSSTLYIGRERRVVHRAEWSITVLNERKASEISFNVSMDVSEVGAVNVSRPDWMSKALEEEDTSVSLVGDSENQTACNFYTTDIETEKIRYNNGSYRVRVYIENWGAADAIHLELDGERRSTIRRKWTDAELPSASVVVEDDNLVQVTATNDECPEGRLLEFVSVG